MTDEHDLPELEHSPLSGTIVEDGISVEVSIFRYANCEAPWYLEVEDEKQHSTLWDEDFLTDQDAYRAFNTALRTKGIHTFVLKH